MELLGTSNLLHARDVVLIREENVMILIALSPECILVLSYIAKESP
jgi:hypothetical protein